MKLIESSTRFTPDDVAVIGEECFECDFEVKVDYVIEANASSKTGADIFYRVYFGELIDDGF